MSGGSGNLDTMLLESLRTWTSVAQLCLLLSLGTFTGTG